MENTLMMPASNVKEKLVGIAGSASGAASVLGSWQICHSVCLGLIALLGVFGIAVAGMPLAFFTTLAIPMWITAFVLLLIALVLYVKKNCISNRIILLNSGLIIAGTPFSQVQTFLPAFWTAGGILFFTGLILFVKDKWQKKHRCHHEH